ncbi:MAG TPA: type II toxin-antitoxin system PemK/MazF family toxin [Candidatus Paceibacterota bacterium]
MQKDFDRWNKRKKRIEAYEKHREVYFDEREVWWAYAGLNVGYEQDGKGSLFLRPVLIIRKFNKHLMTAVPLTTRLKGNPYYLPCAVSDGMARMAIVSQVKALSSKRLYTKIGFITTLEHEKIKNAVKAALDGIPHISGADNPAAEPEGHLYP